VDITRIRSVFNTYPRQFWLMFCGMTISTVGASMIWPFLMIYASAKLGMPRTTVASLMTVNSVAAFCSSILAGPVIDRVGRKGVMVFSLAANGAAYFFLSRANTLSDFALLMALSGMVNPLYRVGGDAMMADLIPPIRRADGYALLRMSNNIGISIGPAIGGFIATTSYAFAFYGATIGLTTYALLLAVFARETIPRYAGTQRESNPLAAYGQIFRDGPFISFVGAFTLTSMCAVLIWVLMGVYAKEQFQIPENQYGFLATTNALMVVFFQVHVTRFTKKYPALRVMVVGSLFYALGVGSVALARNFSGFWCSMVVMTIGELILMPTSSSFVANLAPVNMRGRYMSIYGLTWSVAAAIGPVTGGLLNDYLAPVATWYGGMCIGLLGMAGFIWLSRKPLRPSQASIG
jgi:MFS family permease